MSQPWFERESELLEWELDRFGMHNLPAEIDEQARVHGRLVIHSRLLYRDAEIEIEAHYPDETPELPPVIFGPVGLLDRHEHAFNGNFCLLERPLDDWPAATWGAADLIADRLIALLRDSEAGPDAVRAAEAPMPEPHSSYYTYPFPSLVLMPESLASPERESGTLSLRPFAGEPTRFVVESVSGTPGGSEILAAIRVDDKISAQWKRLATPPPGPNAEDVLRWVRTEHPQMIKPPVPPKLANSRWLEPQRMQVAAFMFSEEGPGVGEMRDAWLFLCVPPAGRPFLAHCQVTSVAERQRRTPGLEALAGARVLVVGLGTLGADAATEFAKAGVGHLDLVDFDRYEINNSVRHVLGVEWSGFAKTQAVSETCRRLNPYCQPAPHNIHLGSVQWSGESSLAELEELVGQADLVVETTGSHQIQNLLGRVARAARVPMVSCWLTAGFYGAHVLRIVPGDTACMVCVARALSANELLEAERGPDDQVIAQGCSHPTVPGAGFDAAETAAIATRLAVQTLLREAEYPDSLWDHAAISFFRAPSDPIFPRFATEHLEPTEGCPQCSSAVGSTTGL